VIQIFLGKEYGCVHQLGTLDLVDGHIHLRHNEFMSIRYSLFSSLVFLVACNLSPEAAKMRALENGNRLFEQGKYPDAVFEYRKALQKDPRFSEAHYRLGLAEWRQENLPAAYAALNQAVESKPDHLDAKIKLAELCLTAFMADSSRPAYLYEKLTRLSNELLAKNPDSFPALRVKGYIAMADFKPKEAIEFLRKANRVKPNQPDVVTVLVQNLLLDQQSGAAEILALDFLNQNKTYGPLYDILYSHYNSTKRAVDAENLLKRKVSNNPKESLFAIQLSDYYWRRGKRQEAQAILAMMADHPKDFPQGRMEVGDFYAERSEKDEAIRQYEAGLRASPKDKLAYQKRIVGTLLSQSKTEEAASRLDETLKEFPDDAQARGSRAALRIATGKPDELDKAIGDLQMLVAKNPDEIAYQYRLASAFRAKRDEKAAKAQLLAILQKRKDHVPSLQALAEIAIRNQQVAEAKRWSDQVLLLDPGNVSARLVHSATLALTGKSDESRAVVDKLLRDYPTLREAQLQRAILFVSEKKYKQAEELFRKHYQPGSGDFRALKGIVEVYMALGQPDRALAVAQEELKKFPQANEVRELLAGTALKTGKFDLTLEQYKYLSEARPNDVDLMIKLANAQHAKGDSNAAIATLEKACKADPINPYAPAVLGGIFDETGRKQEAIASYRQSLTIFPRNSSVLNNLAFLLAETGANLDEALKLALAALQGAPEDPAVLDTVGWIYLKKKNLPTAVQSFQNLVRKRPDNPSFRLHLAMALLESGDRGSAKKELQLAAKMNASLTEQTQIKDALAKLN